MRKEMNDCANCGCLIPSDDMIDCYVCIGEEDFEFRPEAVYLCWIAIGVIHIYEERDE